MNSQRIPALLGALRLAGGSCTIGTATLSGWSGWTIAAGLVVGYRGKGSLTLSDSAGMLSGETSIASLTGSTNRDAIVNSGDSLQTRNRSAQTTDATNLRSDANSDGFVNSGDTFIVRARSGQFIP